MKVLVIGAGGREHALVWKIKKSPQVKEVIAAPGNAGVASLAECRQVAASDLGGLERLAVKERVDFTIVGPEAPLVEGIVDRFVEKGLRIFGPSKAAARLEGSKVYAKELMEESGVPTARFKSFDDPVAAKHFVRKHSMPCVIKADGLAAGKGVTVACSVEEAEATIFRYMVDQVIGDAGKKIVVEEFLQGEELSILAFTDGSKLVPLASSQDHKRAFDHDEGPNTGGMGAYSPCLLVGDSDVDAISRKTIEPVMRTLAQKGTPYRGLIYAGLMITERGPYVLEFNVRFGDPEAQAVLPRLRNDLTSIMLEVTEGKLQTHGLRWDPRFCVSVVLASRGYPGNYRSGFPIEGLEKCSNREDLWVFHAGTKLAEDGRIVTSGGRVLNVVAMGDTLEEARAKAYEGVQGLHFDGRFYRTDIGGRAVQGFSVSKGRVCG